eukprot:GFUD01112160.1.p1 GENE.GFUD01112160.1~~GFUD01112160.1.p1  ORF type:complete len:379 (-),score=87.49 GFUD01112160.1:40-1176(-)
MEEESLRESLECPICRVIPRKLKIFSCKNGHHICEHCLGKLANGQRCPQGDCSYYTPGCRLLVLEGMVVRCTMAVSCIRVREGCTVSMVQGRTLDEHETSCRYRKVPCICCQVSLPLDSLLEHVKNTHDDSEEVELHQHGHRLVGSSWWVVNDSWNESWQWDASWFSHHGLTFYSVLRKENEIWYLRIYTEGSQEEADKLKVTIKIKNRSEIIKYTCNPLTVDHTNEKVMKEGNCLVLNTGQVRRLAVRDGDDDILKILYHIEHDDDLDLFGSDDEEEHSEEKKSKKPALISKTSVLFEVKPWNDETDMEKMLEKCKSIEMDGLLWGAGELVPIGYGMKLQLICVIEDAKVSIEELQEKMTEFKDFIQSVAVQTMNNI